MGRTGRVDLGRVFAGVFVVAAHLAFFWVMTRKIVFPVPTGDASEALQVTWIEPAPAPVPPASAAASRPDAPQTVPRRALRAPAVPPDVATDDTATPSVRAPMSAVFIEQARQLSGTEGDDALFAPDPLAHRRANLPGPDSERFRMRNPPSIRGTLLKIGAMVGGPGYTTDPCPRVASNIGELSQLGDNALLQEELRRKRALCD